MRPPVGTSPKWLGRLWMLAIPAALLAAAAAQAQITLESTPTDSLGNQPGYSTLAPAAEPLLPPGAQVVRFHGPAGMHVELLGPQPPLATFPPEDGLLSVALELGVPYRLRVTNLPDRPGAEFYPVVELVGHLHLPPSIDPTRHPIRIPLRFEEIEEVVTKNRMVKQIVYLEHPDQALPLALPPSEIPVVSLNPAENPMRVAAALGRIVAVVWMGGRVPTQEETLGFYGEPIPFGGPCPFTSTVGNPCDLPCAPLVECPPPPRRPILPSDEYLCDGGDRDTPIAPDVADSFAGLEPRDAAVRFHHGDQDRVVPTNRVCVYAPRFAAVLTSEGPNESVEVTVLQGAEQLQRMGVQELRQEPLRFTQNRSAEINRTRTRASGLLQRLHPVAHDELRVLSGFDNRARLAAQVLDQPAQVEHALDRLEALQRDLYPQGIKTAEGPVVTGIVQGAGQQVMHWQPGELVAVEEPPDRPGLFVIKQVDRSEALPGDELTYVITYRNIGNVPIESVSIVDSLLPRLEYKPGSAQGPQGAVFTAADNQAGAKELRWDVGTLAPGATGAVSFQVKVR